MNPIFSSGIRELRSAFRFTTVGRWFLWAGLVGISTGLVAALFEWFFDLIYDFVLPGLAGYHAVFPPHVSHPWILFLLPAAGGLIAGWLALTFAPEARGVGTDAAVHAFHRMGGYVRPIVPLIKTLATVASIAFGGSGGREGPLVQIGAGIGSLLSRLLRLTERERRMLAVMGMAGGVSAIFRLPIGGAFFAVEVLYRGPDMESDILAPTVMTSVIAYTTMGFFYGWHPIFHIPRVTFEINQLPLYGLLAVGCSIISYVFVKSQAWMEHFFDHLRIPPLAKPVLGGLLTGVVLLFFPAAAATSYSYVQNALLGQLPLTFALLLLVTKTLATGFTIGSGGSGGHYGPSVVVGAMVGTILGQVFHQLWPVMVPSSIPFTLAGIVGFFSAAANVPIASVFMALELTGNYNLIVPTLFVSTLAYLLSSRWTLYETQVFSRIDSPAHLYDLSVDILQKIRVRDILISRPFLILRENEPVEAALHRAAEHNPNQLCFPVQGTTDAGIVGYVFEQDLRVALWEGALTGTGSVLLVEDVMRTRVPTLHPEMDLHEALRHFVLSGLEELPVLNRSGEVIGLLQRKDILTAYDRFIERAREHKNSRGLY